MDDDSTADDAVAAAMIARSNLLDCFILRLELGSSAMVYTCLYMCIPSIEALIVDRVISLTNLYIQSLRVFDIRC